LDCGSFVKRYFETFNKLPDDIPYKHIWYTVLIHQQIEMRIRNGM